MTAGVGYVGQGLARWGSVAGWQAGARGGAAVGGGTRWSRRLASSVVKDDTSGPTPPTLSLLIMPYKNNKEGLEATNIKQFNICS